MPSYLRIDHNHTGSGFINQIIHIVYGILLAGITKRKLSDPIFNVDFRNKETVPFSSIVCIDSLNKLLEELNLETSIVSVEGEWTKSPHYGNLFKVSQSLEEIGKELSQDQSQYLDIGWYRTDFIPPVMIRKGPIFAKIENALYKGIKFKQIFYDIVKSLSINNHYNALHLRLEGDWGERCWLVSGCKKNAQDCIKSLYENYLREIKRVFSPHENIFVSTHLGKTEDENNWVLDDLKTKYSIKTSHGWREKGFSLPQGREINAIVDYIICLNSTNFIGIHGSTFSSFVTRFGNVENCYLVSDH